MASGSANPVELLDFHNTPVSVISHDAGGAEILASFIGQNQLDYRLVLEGPAINVFKRRLGSFNSCSLSDALASTQWCLCGSSWQSDLEWRAIAEAKNLGKHVITFLDHWVNYPERFIRQEIQHLPDEIWVGDEYGQQLAEQVFDDVPVRVVPNPYFIDVMRDIESCVEEGQPRPENEKVVLFASENVSGHGLLRYGDERYWGYTEFDAIDYFLTNIQVIGEPIGKIILRPHPSEDPSKYNQLLKKHADSLLLSSEKHLTKEIAESDIVAGCEGTALVIGILANKRVYSCIPPGGHSCRLPHKEIIEFSELAN